MRDDKRGLPGQRESAGPGQMSREWPSVCTEYSTRSGRKTSNLTRLFPDSPLQKEKNADQGLRLGSVHVYPKSVVAKSTNEGLVTGKRQSAQALMIRMQALFLCEQICVMAICAGGGLRTCRFLCRPDYQPFVQTATPLLGNRSGGSKIRQWNRIMNNPLVTLHQSRAHSQRAMAMSALRSDSSLSVRRKRYNAHMDKARAAEARIRQYAAIPTTQHTHPETRATALSLIEPRLNEWRDNPEPAEGRELVGLICMASALGALSLEDQARIVTHFKPNTQGANNHA